MGGQDIHWDETAVMAGKKFGNKVWNIARFVMTKTDKISAEKNFNPEHADDKAIIEKLNAAKESVEKDIDSYQFGQALHTLYDFIWHEFADKYIELSKGREDEDSKKVLGHVLHSIIKMLHPFMPHLTEAIYQNIPDRKKDFLMVEEW